MFRRRLHRGRDRMPARGEHSSRRPYLEREENGGFQSTGNLRNGWALLYFRIEREWAEFTRPSRIQLSRETETSILRFYCAVAQERIIKMNTVRNTWLFCIPRGNALSAIPCVVIEGFCATNAHVLSAGIPPHITTAFEKNGEHQNKYISINSQSSWAFHDIYTSHWIRHPSFQSTNYRNFRLGRIHRSLMARRRRGAWRSC